MNDKLERAARLIAEARAVKDRTPDGSTMSKADAEQIDKLLREASNLRKDADREHQLASLEDWAHEPQYKHDGDAGQMRGIDGQDMKGFDGRPMPRATKSFLDFVRKGASAQLQHKADLVEDSTGELLVPHDYAGAIFRDVPREAVIRSLAFVRPTTKMRVDVSNLVISQASWGKLELGDSAADGLDGTPADDMQIRVWDLNCLVKIGIDELDDSDDNLEQLIRSQLALKVAEQEDDAFAGGLGDGSKQPFGITHGVTLNVQAAEDNVVTADDLKAMKYRVAANFRRNGVYLVTSEVEEQVALLKDENNSYLLQPATAAGEPSTFAGHRWFTVDGLPGTKGAVFGDVRSGYMIADRRKLTVQRLTELYAASGKLGLLFRHRVGGDVIRPDALAYLELDASA